MTEKKKRPFGIRDMTIIAQHAAIIAVCSWIQIPSSPVPFTLQTFAVFLTVYVLGTKRAILSVLIYILLGAAGLPVFSGFRGGPGILFGATGGFIIGFLFMAPVIGLLISVSGDRPVPVILSMAAGLLVCYLFGAVWFMIFSAMTSGALPLTDILKITVLPFILPDIAKLVLAYLTGRTIKPIAEKFIKKAKRAEDK